MFGNSSLVSSVARQRNAHIIILLTHEAIVIFNAKRNVLAGLIKCDRQQFRIRHSALHLAELDGIQTTINIASFPYACIAKAGLNSQSYFYVRQNNTKRRGHMEGCKKSAFREQLVNRLGYWVTASLTNLSEPKGLPPNKSSL